MNREQVTPEPSAWSWADRVDVLRWARPDWMWWLAFLVVATMYLSRLDAWLINDDEGSYLYAAWRISLGEMPYRDFLTPQLPAFLFPGGLLMKLVGPSAWHARLLAALLTLGTGLSTWLVSRRLFGGWVALVAGVATLLHPLVFADYRTFRADPFMLFFAMLGVLLFARAVLPRPFDLDPPDRRWLVASGAVFGLATLSKLFAPLVAAGCVAWLLAEAWRRRRAARYVVGDLVAFTVPAAIVVAGTALVFVLLTPGVLDAVVGHHLRQGSGQGAADTVTKGLRFYTQFLRFDNNALLAFVAIAVAVTGGAVRDRRATLFAWQLPTALAFLFLSRQLFVRHMTYLIPAMAVLFGVGAVWLGDEVRRRFRPMGDVGTWRAMLADRPTLLAAALVAGLAVPWLINNWHLSWESEHGTVRVADAIALLSAPGELVLSDYSELNFYGQRPTTYSGASFSEGAARSGQISWNLPDSPHRIKDELDGQLPPLLVLDRSHEFAHLRFLQDYEDFAAWVDEHYEPLGIVWRHHQSYEMLAPTGEASIVAAYANGLELLAAGLDQADVEQGEAAVVRAAWRAAGPTDVPAALSVRLVDAAGKEWLAADGHLRASGVSGTKLRTTNEWRAAELVADRVLLDVVPGTPPGDYVVTAGLYATAAASSSGLMEATGPDGAALGQRVPVGRLTVRPGDADMSVVPSWEPGMRPEGGDAGNLSLVGASVFSEAAQPAGESMGVDLWWRSTGPIGEDLSARVTLHERGSGAVAADWTEPLGVPGAGSSTWPDDGVLIRQRVAVPVLADARSGTYAVGVTPVRPDGTLYGVAEGESSGPIEIGYVNVSARDLSDIVTEPPDVDRRLDATVGGVAELYGASLGDVADEAAPIEVELVWRALKSVPVSYKVTVQLLDEADDVVAQHDGEPADWHRPTTGWMPGEVVVDRHALDVTDPLPPGTYRLVAGLYHPQTWERLPVTGADAADGLVVLTTIEVP